MPCIWPRRFLCRRWPGWWFTTRGWLPPPPRTEFEYSRPARAARHSGARILLGAEVFHVAVAVGVVAEQIEGALGFLVGRRRKLHGFERRQLLFLLAHQAHGAVGLEAGAGGNEPAHDDVLLQAAEVVHLALDRGFGEHARGLLEGSGGDEAVGRERSLGDAEQQRTPSGGLEAERDDALVLFAEVELVHLLVHQEFGVADVLDPHPAHHLADNHLDVLVVDVDALEAVHLLDLVDQVVLQLLLAQHGENIVRIAGPVHERLARLDSLALLHGDMDAARQEVLVLLAVVGHDRDLALALADVAVLHGAVNFADDRGFARLAGFEELDHAGQAAGDVLGLGGFARNLGQHFAGGDLLAVLHHQVGVGGHEVLARVLAGTDEDLRLALLVGGFHHHPVRQAGDVVHFLLQGSAFLHVLELHRAGDFGEDREGVRIPLEHDFTHGHRIALVLLEARAVDGGVAFALAAVVVHDRDHAVAVHDHQAAILAAHGRQVDELDEALALGLLPRLLADAAGGAADVEGAHGQLGAGLADGLGGDDADRLAHLDQLAAGQVAPVAGDADTALGLAGEHAADEHALDAGALDAVGQILGDFLVHVHDGVAFVVADALERNAADDAV